MNSGKKKLIIITPGFAASEADTSCIPPLQSFVRELHRRHPDADIRIISIDYPAQEREYTWQGIPVYACGGNNRKYALRRRTAPYRVAKKMLMETPSVVHTFWWGPAAWAGNRLSQKFGIKHICSLMGQDARASNIWMKLLSPKKAELVAQTPAQADEFFRNSGFRIQQVCAPGLDTDLRSMAKPVTIPDIDLLGVGSLIALKQFHLFIEVVRKISGKHPGIRAVIVGDGPERPALEKQTADAGLQNQITFKGQVPREEVLRLMQRSRVLLHPSSFESLGYVYAEALVCGARIVSFRTGIAEEGPRWKVAGNPDELVPAVEAFLSSEDDRTPFWWKGMDETVAFYEKLYGWD